VTYFSYQWTLNTENSAQVLFVFQFWSLNSNVPKELGIQHQLRFGSQQETLDVTVTGSWYGAPAAFENVINPLLALYLENRSQDVRVVSYLESLIIQSVTKGHWTLQNLTSRIAFMPNPSSFQKTTPCHSMPSPNLWISLSKMVHLIGS